MKFSLIVVLGVAILAALNAATRPAVQTVGNNPLSNNPEPAGNPRIKHFRLTKDHVAIDGYDPVSYFKGGPKKGSASRSYDYNGVIYYFTNTGNLAEFKANPAKYEPVWGGWCGHAMALRGEKVDINPECYKIVNGRNVLFFKSFYANALTNWEKEIKKTPENTLMIQGDDFWGKTLVK